MNTMENEYDKQGDKEAEGVRGSLGMEQTTANQRGVQLRKTITAYNQSLWRMPSLATQTARIRQRNGFGKQGIRKTTQGEKS